MYPYTLQPEVGDTRDFAPIWQMWIVGNVVIEPLAIKRFSRSENTVFQFLFSCCTIHLSQHECALCFGC